MKDLLNKLAWGLMAMAIIMALIAATSLYLNGKPGYGTTTISGFFYTMLIILFGSGLYLRSLAKKEK